MIGATAELTAESKKNFKRDIKILSLDDKRKKTILRNVIKATRKDATQSIRGQSSPYGGRWTPRKKRKTFLNKKGKELNAPMLKRVLTGTRNTATPEMGKLSYKNSVSARIAAEHQEGATLAVKGGKHKNQKTEQHGAMATAEQAALLLELGFNEPKHPAEKRKRGRNVGAKKVMEITAKRMLQNDSRRRKPSSVGYITSHLTFGQAGTLIALLKQAQGKNSKAKSTFNLPARPFLNESPEKAEQHFQASFDKEVTKKL